MKDPVISQIQNDLDEFNSVEYKWYQVRLDELIKLRKSSNSNTSKELMDGACTLTNLSYSIWAFVAKETTEFMHAVASKYEKAPYKKTRVLESNVVQVNQAFTELTKSLIYKTYKPNHKEFHKESAKELVVSALKKIDSLSILDDIESLRKIDPNYRLNKQLKSGDEVISYIEDYNEQIVEWAHAAKRLEIRTKELKRQLTKGCKSTPLARRD